MLEDTDVYARSPAAMETVIYISVGFFPSI
jgi:hypothetical protein